VTATSQALWQARVLPPLLGSFCDTLGRDGDRLCSGRSLDASNSRLSVLVKYSVGATEVTGNQAARDPGRAPKGSRQ